MTFVGLEAGLVDELMGELLVRPEDLFDEMLSRQLSGLVAGLCRCPREEARLIKNEGIIFSHKA